jgi:hypothetical protein
MNTNAGQPSVANGTNEPYLDQLDFLLGLNDSLLPSVLSTSYAEDEETVPCASESLPSTDCVSYTSQTLTQSRYATCSPSLALVGCQSFLPVATPESEVVVNPTMERIPSDSRHLSRRAAHG